LNKSIIDNDPIRQGWNAWANEHSKANAEVIEIIKKTPRRAFETHPFIWPFDDSTNELKIIKAYKPVRLDDEMTNYHWRVQDMVNSMFQSGLTIRAMEELFA